MASSSSSSSPSSPLPSYIKPAVLRFKELEKAFLGGLSNQEKKQLAGGKLKDFKAHHLYHYGEVAFTLGGLKPCVLIAHGSMSSFASDLASKCARPVMEEFQLESHGFQLHQISHRLLTSNPRHPGFQGAAILVNTQHPDFALVRDVFLTPRTAPVPELLIGRALGYPLPSGDGTVAYMDASEMEAAGVCCVQMMEYFCDKHPSPEECMAVVTHVSKHSAFWQQLGWRLSVNMEAAPGVERFWQILRARMLSQRG